MGHLRSSHAVSSFRLSLPNGGPGTGPTVVRLWGEHDIATDGELRRVLACVIGADDPAIVLDLSHVEPLSASTLVVIAAARELLRDQSRTLTVRLGPRRRRRDGTNVTGP
jgi:anti-anti-sigma regulatory factor